MSKKRALIVDDSKSARVVLGRMLQKYDIEVDTAESAERAIDYLKQNRPDVIFMDHLMPGMDGFQAVQAIKSNPQTATIPIMMYTSQQGELYVGQARALGAVGVLPKLVKPVDVSKVLYQLHLLPERRDFSPPAFINANPAATTLTPKPGAAATAVEPGLSTADSQLTAGLVPADWYPQLESAFRNHDAELRRFVVANLDSFADRIGGDLRNYLNDLPALQAPPPVTRQPTYLWVTALVLALLPGILLGVFYMRALDSNRQMTLDRTRLEQSNTQLSDALDRLARRESELAATMAPAAAESAAAPAPSPSASGPITKPLIEPVPYGEVPLALARVDTLRNLLARLRAQAFRGQIRVETFAGQFCLKSSTTDGYVLAPPNLPAAECDLIGNPHEEGLSSAQHESLAFANVASGVRQQSDAGMTIDVELAGERVLAPYPRKESVTAGQWNEIAARNNRVEFRAVPAS